MPKKIGQKKGNSAFTGFQVEDAALSLFELLRPIPGIVYDLDNTPSRPDLDPKKFNDKADYELEKSRLSPSELEYIKTHQQEALDVLIDNRVEFTFKANQKNIDNFFKKIKADYKPLTSSEQKEKAKMSELIRKKYAQYSAKRALAESFVNRSNTGPKIDRGHKCLLSIDLSADSYKLNDKIKGYLNSPDPKEKAKAYAIKLEELAQIDISGIDPTDDQYIIDHFEELESMISSAPEMRYMLDNYQNLGGVDMTGEEYKPVFEKLGAMAAMADMIKLKIDVMASPLYSQLRTDEIFGLGNFLTTVTDTQGNVIEEADVYKMLCSDGQDDYNGPYAQAIYQLMFRNELYNGHTLLDKNLKPEERYAKYCAEYWDSPKEMVPLKKQPVADVKKELPKEDPAVEVKIELPKEEKGAANKPAENEIKAEDLKPKAEEFVSDMPEQEAIMRRNIAKIQQIIPNFKVSEEQLKAYFTPERIKIRENALKYSEKLKANAPTKKGIQVPESFARSFMYLTKHPDEPGAEEYNAHLAKMINDQSPEGDQFRKQLMVDLMNKFKNLDASKFSLDKSFNEIAQYAMQNQDLCGLGFESQNMLTKLPTSLGITFVDELADDVKNTRDKASLLGGAGSAINLLAASDSFFIMPFEQLSVADSEKLMSSGVQFEGLTMGDLVHFHNWNLSMKFREHYVEPNTHKYKLDDMKFPFPSLDEIHSKSIESLQQLQDAKSVFSRTNSDEYNKLTQSLEQLNKVLENKDNNINFKQDFKSALKDANLKVRLYIKHVGLHPKNETQLKRLNIANSFKDFISEAIGDLALDIIASKYLDSEALESSKELADERQEELKDEYIVSQEKLFEEGLKITDAKRAAFNDAPEGMKKDFMGLDVKARDVLTNYVGRDKLYAEDRIKINSCVATIVANKMYEADIKDIPDNFQSDPEVMDKYKAQVSKILSDDTFTQKIHSLDINEFLAPGGDKAFTDSYIKRVNQVEARNKDVEKIGKDLVKDKQDVQPQKESEIKNELGNLNPPTTLV